MLLILDEDGRNNILNHLRLRKKQKKSIKKQIHLNKEKRHNSNNKKPSKRKK